MFAIFYYYCLVIIIIITTSGYYSLEIPPTNISGTVNILKCCDSNEYLNDRSVCVTDVVNQAPATTWAPVVYSPTKPGYLDPGTIPKNWQFLENRRPICKENNVLLRVAEGPHYVTFVNGSLFWLAPSKLLHPDQYCIARKGALVCVKQEDSSSSSSNLERRVKKCCGRGAVYSEQRLSCVLLNGSVASHFISENTMIITGFPTCPETDTYVITGKLNVDYELNADGTLRSHNGDRLGRNDYCAEKILENRSTDDISVFTCGHRFKNHHGGADDANDIRYTLYPLAMFLSVFFLALTLISSCLLPSSYHALHWKCQTHYVACLLVGDLLLAITQVYGSSLQGKNSCVILATAVHFLFLAAFFWLNTMCFNIWWTFRDLRPTSLDKSQEAWRLKLYELYAWGGPLIIVTIGVLMDQVFYRSYPDAFRPRFGEKKCWFYGNSEILVYFFGPVAILLTVNIILFTATTRELTCGLWKREMVKSTTERTTLSHICLKLVIVMGITWFADVLSWIIGGPDHFWYPTDIINGLQGFFIFIVVGCQPQVLSNVKRMWCFRNSHGRNRSSSSNAMPSMVNDQSSSKPVETLC